MELCPQQSHRDFPSCILFRLPWFPGGLSDSLVPCRVGDSHSLQLPTSSWYRGLGRENLPLLVGGTAVAKSCS